MHAQLPLSVFREMVASDSEIDCLIASWCKEQVKCRICDARVTCCSETTNLSYHLCITQGNSSLIVSQDIFTPVNLRYSALFVKLCYL